MMNAEFWKDLTADASPSQGTMSAGPVAETDLLIEPTNVGNKKSCDKLSTSSDLTFASAFSGSFTSVNASAAAKAKVHECIVCCLRQSMSNFMELINCNHRSCCKTCLIKFLNVEIMENRTVLSCPQCTHALHVNDVYAILAHAPELLDRYENFSLRRVLLLDPDARWCPAPDCTYAVIASQCAACPQLSCARPGCGTMFCYHCKNYWHPNQACEREIELSDSIHRVEAHDGETIKSCPRCAVRIVKANDGTCNHMTCTVCGVEFCWLCLKQINELHYISPSGCTFWGKRPWTRKKKLFCQIGMLIGAPLGIALLAGLAVPGIICGFPIFIGRKTYQRFSNSSRTKRHSVTAVSVTGSLLVSPVLAVMAVGVGVPIMIAYVYGVIPFSLCRTEGCASADDADVGDIPYTADEEAAPGTSVRRSRLARFFRRERRTISNVVFARGRDARTEKTRQNLEVTMSDRSNASSPSAAFLLARDETFRRNADGAHSSATHVASLTDSFSLGDKSQLTSGGAAFNARLADGVGCSVSRVISAQTSIHYANHYRKHSTESGVTSLGEKNNTEDASIKAIAGSHYNYDDRSVHTIWSSGCGAPNAQSANDGASGVYRLYTVNDENASTKACGGSVLEARSLAESATSSTLPQLAFLSRERDVSPLPHHHHHHRLHPSASSSRAHDSSSFNDANTISFMKAEAAARKRSERRHHAPAVSVVNDEQRNGRRSV